MRARGCCGEVVRKEMYAPERKGLLTQVGAGGTSSVAISQPHHVHGPLSKHRTDYKSISRTQTRHDRHLARCEVHLTAVYQVFECVIQCCLRQSILVRYHFPKGAELYFAHLNGINSVSSDSCLHTSFIDYV